METGEEVHLLYSCRLLAFKFTEKYSGCRLQIFFKIGFLKQFRNIHRKTPALESLFNKVAGPATLLKRDSNIGVFL